MKLAIKIGDKVQVTKGTSYGKEAKVVEIDKKNNRYKLDSLKKSKSKGKGGKELHGSFHVASLRLLKAEPPKKEEKPATEAPAKEAKKEAVQEAKKEAAQEAKKEAVQEAKKEAVQEAKKEAAPEAKTEEKTEDKK